MTGRMHCTPSACSNRSEGAASTGETLRVDAGLVILGRVWLEVELLLAFLLRGERGAFLRLRDGRLGAVAGLSWLQGSGARHRNAVLVGGARWRHRCVLLREVRGLVRMRVHVGRERLTLARGVRRVVHGLFRLRSSPSGPRRLRNGRRPSATLAMPWHNVETMLWPVGRRPTVRRGGRRGEGRRLSRREIIWTGPEAGEG